MTQDELKTKTGYAAIDALVKSGMKIGMGTGSTAAKAIERLGQLYKSGEVTDILVVPTSMQTAIECQSWGIPLRTLNDPDIDGQLDIAIDGADEVDPGLNVIKGGGAAHLAEKLVEYSAHYLAIIVDASKMVDNLALKFPLPVEVIPEARVPVTKALARLGANVTMRMAMRKIGPVITEHGNIILDCVFASPFDPAQYEVSINTIPGVVENGIFSNRVSEVFVAHSDGRVERIARK